MKKLLAFVSLCSGSSAFAIPMNMIHPPAVLMDLSAINEHTIKAALMYIAIVVVGTGVVVGAKKLLK